MSGSTQAWQHLVSGETSTEALLEHFQIFGQSPDSRDILTRWLQSVMEVKIGEDASLGPFLRLVFPFGEDGDIDSEDDDRFDLRCYAPFEGNAATSVPSSYAQVAKLHNRIEMGSRDYDIPLIWWGLDGDGQINLANGSDEDLMRGEYDEKFIAALAADGSGLGDVRVPISFADGWYLMDPTTRDGEDGQALRYVSGESNEVSSSPMTHLSHAGALLCLLAKDHVKHRDIASVREARYGSG